MQRAEVGRDGRQADHNSARSRESADEGRLLQLQSRLELSELLLLRVQADRFRDRPPGQVQTARFEVRSRKQVVCRCAVWLDRYRALEQPRRKVPILLLEYDHAHVVVRARVVGV